MRTKLLFYPLLALSTLSSFAQSAKYNWSMNMGSSSNDRGTFITTDMAGNIYTAGIFRGTADIAPGPLVLNVNSFGMSDIFLTKQDPSGGLIWAKNFGGPFEDEAISISIDPAGNLFLSGTFMGISDFSPGVPGFSLATKGDKDIFMLKLDNLGNINWAKSMGGIETDLIKSSVYDKTGYLYSTGCYRGTVDFNPGPGIANLTSVGETDIFIHKLDFNGNYIWSRSVGTIGEDTGTSIATDVSGNVYIVGNFTGGGDFNPGSGVSKIISAGRSDIFILKLNSSGNFLWVKQMGGLGNDKANSIHITDSGFIYITGTFNDIADFNPSLVDTDTVFLTPKGDKDMFLVKLDLSGNYIWAKNVGTASAECVGIDVKSDIPGNAFVSGVYTASIDFDPDTSTFVQSSKGMHDVFITKFDKNGNFSWVKSFGGIGEDSCFSMEIDQAINIFTTGSFRDTVDFNPAKEISLLGSMGNSDIFIHKMSFCTPKYTTIKDTICRAFTLDGVTYSETGIYKQTITSTTGCEEFVTLDLDVHHINDTVTVSGVVLTAKATGVKYQWINCKKGKSEIPGATGRSYIALGNSEYAVTLFDGRCRDTSECTEISSFPTSLEEFETQNSVQIYPNPTNAEFVISVSDKMIGGEASIYNLLGQKVRTVELKGSNTAQSLNSGFYLIEVKQADRRIIKKIQVL